MKISTVLLLFLTATLAVPLGFSGVQADDQSTNANQTGANQTLMNPVNASSTENVGQQVSDFVHNATAIFKQQRDETIQAIKDCREKAQNATGDNRTQIMSECHTTLSTIRDKYQDVRNQFQELFKRFRDSIITLRHHEEGLGASDQDRDNAIKKINDDFAQHGMKGLDMALGHLKRMGENGTMGIEKALKHGNETGEYNQTGMPPMSENRGDQNQHGPPMSSGQSGSQGPPGSQGKH